MEINRLYFKLYMMNFQKVGKYYFLNLVLDIMVQKELWQDYRDYLEILDLFPELKELYNI